MTEKERLLETAGEFGAPPQIDIEPHHDIPHLPDAASVFDGHSITSSQYEALIHDELERIWILNLSMHFRDRSKRRSSSLPTARMAPAGGV